MIPVFDFPWWPRSRRTAPAQPDPVQYKPLATGYWGPGNWPDPYGPDPVVFGSVPRVSGESS